MTRQTVTRSLACACLALALFLAPASAATAAPANDDFADAQPVGLPDHVTGTITDATLEPGEPGTEGVGSITSIWYVYTAAAEQRVKVDTCGGSTTYAALIVYTGSNVAGLSRVASGRGFCAGGARTTFTATAGTTYHIAINGYRGDVGDVSLTLSVPQPPANDDFADAQVIALSDAVAGTIDDATLEPGEPDPSGAGAYISVWYRYVAVASGPVKLDTCASTFFARTTVFTGADVGGLTQVARHSPDCAGGGRTYFAATAGTTYSIAITGPVDDVGAIALSIGVPHPPPNDDFASARAVGMPESVTGTNVDATAQAGEPDPVGDGAGHSVWYRLQMNTTQAVGIDTCGSELDTVVGVYTGSSVGALTAVGVDDDSCDLGSIVDFVSSPGTTYYIMVTGFGGQMGDFKLLAGGPHASSSPQPSCPPAGSPAGAIGYAGTHSGGGSVCLAVVPGFSGVSSFHVLDAPGDTCHFGFAIDRFSPAVPIVNRTFSTAKDALSGSFPTDRGARGTFQLTRTTDEDETCTSPVLSWTAATAATPPWAVLAAPAPAPPPPAAPTAARPALDRTPPTLRLRGATTQRPLRSNRVVVVVQCRAEACTAKATTSVAGVKLASRPAAVRRGRSRTLTLKLTRRARKALRAALRAHRSVRVSVLVVARDGVGNSASARRAIRLRR